MCSRHFKNSTGRRLQLDEYPTENFPKLTTRVSTHAPKRPLIRMGASSTTDEGSSLEEPQTKEVGVNTDVYDDELSKLRARVVELEEELSTLHKEKCRGVSNI